MPITKRDRIWRAALDIAREIDTDPDTDYTDKYGFPGFTVSDVAADLDEPITDRTIRDCLSSMAELGVLSKRTSKPARYQPNTDSPHFSTR